MAVAWTDIRDWISGEFSTLTEAQITTFINQAARRLDAGVWGERYDDGHLYLAMHLIATARRDSSDGGATTMVTAGPLSRQYASRPDPDDYDSTTHGRQFKQLASELPSRPIVLRGAS